MLCGYKETESLVEGLMKMKMPDYKPTSNHVQFLIEVGRHLYNLLHSRFDFFLCFGSLLRPKWWNRDLTC